MQCCCELVHHVWRAHTERMAKKCMASGYVIVFICKLMIMELHETKCRMFSQNVWLLHKHLLKFDHVHREQDSGWKLLSFWSQCGWYSAPKGWLMMGAHLHALLLFHSWGVKQSVNNIQERDIWATGYILYITLLIMNITCLYWYTYSSAQALVVFSMWQKLEACC